MPTSFSDDLVYNLSHPGNKFAMNSAIPGMTSAWILDYVDKRLTQVRDSSQSGSGPAQIHAIIYFPKHCLKFDTNLRLAVLWAYHLRPVPASGIKHNLAVHLALGDYWAQLEHKCHQIKIRPESTSRR